MSLNKFFIISSLAFCLFGFGCTNQTSINNIPNEVSEPTVSTENNNQPIVDNNLPPQWIEVPTSSVSESVDIQNWKNYTNPMCGFYFNYPNDAVVGVDEEKVVGITTQESLNFQRNQEGEVPSFYYIYVSCLEDLPTLVSSHGDGFDRPADLILSLEDFFSANTNPVIRYIGQTEVDGYPAFKTIVGMDNSYMLWIERDEIVYQLVFSTGSENNNLISSTQQEILSSFKFVE